MNSAFRIKWLTVQNTNRIPDIYYDVLKAIRNQKDGKWEYKRNGSVKVINAVTDEVVCVIPIDEFTKQSDIYLMVHDIMSGRDDTFGFSIKSQLGSPATLLNVSGATNFIYKLTGHMLTGEEISKFEELKLFKDKFDYLNSLGTDIEFIKIDNDIFDFNLKMVSGEMPEVFAEMIKIYYKDKIVLVSELTDKAVEANIVDTLDNKIYLRHKVKELLTNIALGMVPKTIWTGDYEATGGYIIVKDDGDVVCYHIYNHNAFKNYMFANTRFDTPSKTKHGFGSIYTENGKQYLKLNIQIRFTK